MSVLTCTTPPAYSELAVTLLAAKLGSLNDTKAHKRHRLSVGAFLLPTGLYGGCARDAFGRAGFLCVQSANLRTVTTLTCLAASRGDSKHKGVSLMSINTTGTSVPTSLLRKITAHRRMAIAALRADSSASVRLARYNSHMSKARALEAVGVCNV